ncbi:expressed unknown protein [Seminavis robusta]|uniref:Arabinogalactan protein n=1 Tax=Seminavis robusta TaxID=568900 RepID=A0A9N8DKI4_9STRA|nr:expressed unknown protein [Seminavis robusta]|eukprot:Sro205_g086120.1 n/a (187) ;mRNA; f:6847-7533
MKSSAAISTILFLLVATLCDAFVTKVPERAVISVFRHGAHRAFISTSRSSPKIFLSTPSEPEKEEDKASEAAVSETPSESPSAVPVSEDPPKAAPPAVVVPVEEEESSVPIDLPSPLLLASSMILGIVSTGSIFDLLGGNPSFGFAPTAGVALTGLPLCLFLFTAAIAKGQKETEEDDEEFRRGGF